MNHVQPPKINKSTASDMAARVRAMVPHYTPEWSARDGSDPGVGLLQVFSFLAEGVISRLNHAPKRNFIAFLEMLGIRRLPATPARVPICFLVSQGEEDALLVPERARATAAAVEERPELPFETEKPLSAIPGGLTTLIAVDPAQDRIYKPPPGFLDLSVAAVEVPAYTFEAFSSKDSSSFQLQIVDGLQEKDILELTTADAQATNTPEFGSLLGTITEPTEFVIISRIQGRIVTVTEPLRHDYSAGSQARKVTHFELLRGKNLQEHVLYLAHSKLFNLKSEAHIELELSRAPGSAPTTEPLLLHWEHWGEIEVAGEKKEDWRPVITESDTTNTLGSSGRITLRKLSGEIKEKEIDGKKSRWLRARLAEDQLGGQIAPSLPQLESVQVRVSTAVTLKADQGFHNDTPLDVTQEFHPFGVEPRVFDRFYIASEEAFSKPNAKVSLHPVLDSSGLLPAAIEYAKQLRVFACGLAGQLLEFRVDPTSPETPEFLRHSILPGSRIAEGSIPAVCLDESKTKIGVFLRAENGQIYLAYYLGSNDEWQPYNLAAPQAEKTSLDLAVTLLGDRRWEVFVVSDGRLYSRSVNPENLGEHANWEPRLQKDSQGNHTFSPYVHSTPFVTFPINGTAADTPWVFVTDRDRLIWYWDGNSWIQVTSRKPPGNPSIAVKNARPLAFRTKDKVIVYFRNEQNQLVAINTENKNSYQIAPAGVTVASDPFAVVRTDEKGNPVDIQIFVRDIHDQLWSIDEGFRTWHAYGSHPKALLKGSPVAVSWTAQDSAEHFFSVFVASDKNSLLELRRRSTRSPKETIAEGPQRLFLVSKDEDDDKNPQRSDYIYISSGAAKNEFREIEAVHTFRETLLAIVKHAWSEIPEPGSQYQLLRYRESGQVKGATRGTIKLPPDTRAMEGDFVIVVKSLQIRKLSKLKNESTKEKEFTVTEPWASPLPKGDYILLKAKHLVKSTSIGMDRFVILSKTASQQDEIYKGQLLQIIDEQGGSVSPKTIVFYSGSVRLTQVDSPFSIPYPTEKYSYQLLFNEDTWFLHEHPSQTEPNPELSWEYWNGNGWLRLEVSDSTHRLLNTDDVIFSVPPDLAKTEVAGQDNYWIRARIVGGDYGRETFVQNLKTGKLEIQKDSLRPPLIKDLTLSYELTTYEFPEYCLTCNHLSYIDQTAANKTDDKFFSPFTALPDTGAAVYFGFSKSFKGGPVRLFCAAQESQDLLNPPTLTWEFSTGREWRKLTADDDSHAFTRPGIVSLSLPEKLHRRFEFGESLHWIRATVAKENQWKDSPRFAGVFINSVWAIQAETVLDEILGGSSAEANQQFNFSKGSILKGEEVRVREVLTDEEKRILVDAEGKDVAIDITDLQVPPADGQQISTADRQMNEVWVRWHEIPDFSGSTGDSRHYQLDRATGQLLFGDGIHGRIPPAGGDNIRAFSYRSGGGTAGNVAAGDVAALVTAIAGVDSVSNPISAGGGSDVASTEAMLTIGPAQISHRGRAVTPEDFEWLAKEASREIRRVRCVANRNKAGRNAVGWISVYVVPDSLDAQPVPSLQLREQVRHYLAERADLMVANQDQIYVDKPTYVAVHVEVIVCARSLDVVAEAERDANSSLTAFLHPLTGGRRKEGWEFGQGVNLSDLYALLEAIPAVDHVEQMQLSTAEGTVEGDKLDIDPHSLIASGEHSVSVTVVSGS